MKTTLIKVLSLVMAFFCLTNVYAQETTSVSIIPQPLEMETKEGEFLLPEKVVIAYDKIGRASCRERVCLDV